MHGKTYEIFKKSIYQKVVGASMLETLIKNWMTKCDIFTLGR